MTLRFISLAVFIFLKSAHSDWAQSDDWQSSEEKLKKLLQYLHNNYVEKLSAHKLTEDAIKGILKSLDPHSYYMTKQEAQEANEQLQGNFEGIGIHYHFENDTLYILGTVEDSPADRAGICPGDRLIRIEDSLIAGEKKSTKEITRLIKHSGKAYVRLSVLRPEEGRIIDFKIKKERIPSKAITAAYMLNENVGYIRLARFTSTAPREFREAIKKLQKSGMQNMLLDLRDNSGGYLTAAVDIAGEFLPKQSLIVYTEGLHSSRKNYETQKDGIFLNGQVIVLIDQSSASASEIVAGALQDKDRGLIAGRRSFGKGLVQNTYYFSDGSAIRLTTARYYTPSGRCIQRPYTPGKSDDYNAEMKFREKRGELFHRDSIKQYDTLKFFTSNGRIVFGGGGIIPDIFIPRNSIYNDSLFKNLNKDNLLNSFAISWLDKNRKKFLQTYPNALSFHKNFQVTQDFLEDLVKYYRTKSLELTPTEWNNSMFNRIINFIKSAIARNAWDIEESLMISNTEDPDIQLALKYFGTEGLSILKNDD